MSLSKVREYGTIQEMAANADLSIEVPLAPGVDLAKLTEGDEAPMFVTIDALSEGVSRNKRRYTLTELNSIAEQVNKMKPDGYLGHLAESERAHKYPDAVTLWLGAKVQFHKGKNRLFIKGYVLPSASGFRDTLRRALVAGKNLAVSIYGSAVQVWNDALRAYDMRGFALESIDWARPGSEGVPNSGYLTISAEMSEGDNMERSEVLKSTTISEMQENNPTLVEEIQSSAKADLEKVVSEMTEALEVEKADELVSTVTEMAEENKQLKREVADNFLDRELGSKIPSVAGRAAVRKLVVSEMSGDYTVEDVEAKLPEILESAETKALVQEMTPSTIVGGGESNRQVEDGSKKSKYIRK